MTWSIFDLVNAILHLGVVPQAGFRKKAPSEMTHNQRSEPEPYPGIPPP